MATTTPLADYAKSLDPETYDKAKAKERSDAIEQQLQEETACTGMFESGSWSHGTAVAGHSDVDWMALYPVDARPVYPSSALGSLKQAVAGSHWWIYELKQSSPTVQVEFFTEPNFEIVPAFYKKKVGDYYVLSIPGPGDEWIEAAPRAHLDYVTEQNVRLNWKLKPLVRLVKAWKYYVDVPVSSFYLEMRTAQYASGESSIVYGYDLSGVMCTLEEISMRAMNDPTGLVSRIPATSSEAKRMEALRLVDKARDALIDALTAEANRDAYSYYAAMITLFGTNFPYPNW